MTQCFEDMIMLLGAAVHGTMLKPSHKYQVKKIKELACSQGVWPLIYPELNKVIGITDESVEFMSAIAKAIQRNAYNLDTIYELEQWNIEYCLLKGQAIASIYPHPDYRISGDTDILIKPKDEKKVLSILEKRGYRIEKRKKNDHHFKAWHSVGGLLEVHIRLLAITTKEILFGGLEPYHEQRRQITIYGKKIWTLGYNDGLMYLTAHYINHLICGGGGIRQILDLLLYMEKYESEIDMALYYKTMVELKYDRLIDTLKTIGSKYLGFSYPITDENLAEKLLSDCEEGGIFGFETDTRKGFYQAYCKRRPGNHLQGKWILAVKSESTLLSKFFASPNVLKREGYSLAAYKLLVPYAWMHRAFDIMVRKRREKDKRKNNIEKRMKLMKEIHMIDE